MEEIIVLDFQIFILLLLCYC